jgi:hypothetical protein
MLPLPLRKLLCVLLLGYTLAPAQRLRTPPTLDASQQFNLAKYTHRSNRSAALWLGGYSLLGMMTGFGFGFNTDLPLSTQYAWRTTGFWNVVNAGVAGAGYASSQARYRKLMRTGLGNTTGLEVNRRAQNLYGINIGLDISYALVGGYLWRRSRTFLGNDRLRQEGVAVGILSQAGALLVFDSLWYVLQRRNVRRVLRADVQPQGLGLALVW